MRAAQVRPRQCHTKRSAGPWPTQHASALLRRSVELTMWCSARCHQSVAASRNRSIRRDHRPCRSRFASSNMKPCPTAGAMKSGFPTAVQLVISSGTTFQAAAWIQTRLTARRLWNGQRHSPGQCGTRSIQDSFPLAQSDKYLAHQNKKNSWACASIGPYQQARAAMR